MSTPEKIIKIQERIIDLQNTVIKRYNTIQGTTNERIKTENLESIANLMVHIELLNWALNPDKQ